jgi:hypothetical protein
MINKRIKLFALVGVLSLLFGCSGAEAPAENKSQDEAPKVVEEPVTEEPKEEVLDLKDMDKLYEYYNANVTEFERSEFDTKVTTSYLDVTGDGVEEVILIDDFGMGNPITIISIENNEYKNLSDNITTAKYMNEFSLQDGFLVLKQKTGGSGMADTYMSLYKYNGEKLVEVLNGIYLEGHFAGPGVFVERKSTFEGPLTDFDYLLVEEDMEAMKRKVEESKHYTYNEDNFSFTIKDIDPPEIETTIKEEVYEEEPVDFTPGQLLQGYGKVTYGPEEIDMNEYVAVALPMYSGEYNDRLEALEYNIGTTNSKSLTVSFFGKYENVKIVYYADNNAEEVITEVGNIENKLLTVNGDFDNPEAYVRIECDVNGSDDRWSSSFNLDPSRDENSNMQLTIE